MIADLRPYPAYRELELRWLERIPSHWDVLRAKSLFREIDERSSTGKEDLLSVSHITGVTKRSETNATMFLAKSNKGHKICRPGDLVINTMWAWMGALAISPHTGLVSPSYGTYRPIGKNALLGGYAHELLRTPQYVSEYISRSTGIHSSRLRLYPEQFLCIPMLCPPNEEQAAIFRFLNHATRRIADAIRQKRKLIALLNEQKQTIIQRLVTRGIDPNAPLKPSGIPWIGDVPHHWVPTRIKNEFECLNSRRIPLSAVERGRMKTREYDYYGASGVIDKVDQFLFDDELLLLAEDGANLVLRNLPLAIVARGRFWVNNHAHILRPKRGTVEYLAGYLETLNYRPWITGAAQPKLTRDRLMGIAICIAPPEEQEPIMVQIDIETAPLRSAILRAEREVELVREYRTRLIADVVTGQLDTREAAINLPAEVEAEGVIALEEDDESEELPEAVADDE